MEYTKELHEQTQELYNSGLWAQNTETISKVVSYIPVFLREITRLQSLTRWVRYIEGDTSTYPQKELCYQILTSGNPFIPTCEYYNFIDGWNTDRNVIYYREIDLPPEGVK